MMPDPWTLTWIVMAAVLFCAALAVAGSRRP